MQTEVDTFQILKTSIASPYFLHVIDSILNRHLKFHKNSSVNGIYVIDSNKI